MQPASSAFTSLTPNPACYPHARETPVQGPQPQQLGAPSAGERRWAQECPGEARMFSEAETHGHWEPAATSPDTPQRVGALGSTGGGGGHGPGTRRTLPPVWRPSRRIRTQRKPQAPRALLIAEAALGSEDRSTFQLSPKCTERGKAEPPEPRARSSSPSSQRPPPARRPRPFSAPLLASPPSFSLSLPPYGVWPSSFDLLIP